MVSNINKLVVYPLVLLLFLGVFYQLILLAQADLSSNSTVTLDTINGTQTLNGTDTEYVQDIDAGLFDVNMTTGLIVLIIGLVVVGVVAGIKVVGSGLDTYSVKLIHKSVVYYGIWGIFSALSYAVFVAFPYSLGALFWFGLTFVYSLGFFESLRD